MTQEELKQAAKEFCQAKGIKGKIRLDVASNEMAQFAQYLIDKCALALSPTPKEIDLKIAGQKLFGILENMMNHGNLSDLYFEWANKVMHETDEILADDEDHPKDTPQLGEVKSAESVLRSQFYGDEWIELMSCLNTDVTPSVVLAMEEYANQFKATPSSAGKEVKTDDCELHGCNLQPVVSFDNEISDYQCSCCGQLESKITQVPFDDDILKKSYKMLEKRNRDLEKEVQHYRDQFKSSPASTATPTKVISDDELERAKDFKIWCDNQVIAGRTTHKLFLDWREQLTDQKS